MKRKSERCEFCEYAHQVKNIECKKKLICCFNPPTPFVLMPSNTEDGATVVAARPPVESDDYCHFFQRKFGY
jgi:hypothetical protein